MWIFFDTSRIYEFRRQHFSLSTIFTISDGKYSTTYPPSHTSSINSSPHCDFPSDNSTESTPTPLFPEDIPYKNDPHNDSDSGSSFANFDVHDIQIPKSETVIKKRAVLQLTEIPFSILMQWIRMYLISIENDPNKPDYPVPDMDKNQKRNFRRTTESSKSSTVTLSTFTSTSMRKIKLKEVCKNYLLFMPSLF